ncbi:serine/threonine-protein kinase [Nocardioides sp. cx-173]|uniref:serine/threonine-protein kinase n=1 Tax=Nocardioides sp. cx-173 TaxID=2898796 RepID=UPI0022AC846F|nr:serine/threonine-protein kinase [Nocardioides sp. cx-173]
MIAGRYSLDREIGRGGMGAVWLGRDEVLGRPVALKRIGMMPGGSSPDLLRAEREARLAARLNHPHVVAVFDLVDEGDAQWLVMEYVEGRTLAELVRAEGPLPVDRAAQIVVQAAEALAAAHTAGIVHRDVKPSNILVTPEGQVKLSDFGIARAEADASLTQTGLVTGSPAYISPEVASGRQATDLSDVWSLGATLYHALAGRPPYDIGDNVIGGLYRIVHEDPPRLSNAGWLTPLLESSMTVDPQGRWSMQQVVEFLRAGPTATAPRPVGRRRALATDGPPDVAPSTQVMSAVLPRPTDDAGTRPARRQRRMLPAVAAVAVLVLATVIALLAGLNRGDDPPADRGTAGDTPSTTSEPPQKQVTAAGMEEFGRSYPAIASSDPGAGFELLTPDYQARSDQYEEVWSGIQDPQVDDVRADPKQMTVTYTYRYERNGNPITEEVTLTLVGTDGEYKIADATSRRL